MIIACRYEHANFKKLIPFINSLRENDGYIKCESSGYLPLNFNELFYNDYKGRPVFSISHNDVMNGDLMADPDMTFSVDFENEKILPLTYQNDYMGVYQEVFKRDDGGPLMYSKRLLIDLDDFLHTWLKNIEFQGFVPPEKKA